MFGTLKVNGAKVARKLTAADALPGFLFVVDTQEANTKVKVGDLLLKTSNGWYVVVYENPTVLDWHHNNGSTVKEQVLVRYVDMELNYKAEDE